MAFGDLIQSIIDEEHISDGASAELTVTFSSAPSEGDLIVGVVTANVSHSAPSGFSETCNQTDGSDEHALYYKVAGSSEGTTFNFDVDSNTTERCLIAAVFDGGTNGFDATPLDTSKVDTKETGSSSVETDTSGSGLTSTNANNLMLAGAYMDQDTNSDVTLMYVGSENGFTLVEGDCFGTSVTAGGLALVLARRTVTATATFNPRFQVQTYTAENYNYGFVVGFKEGSAAPSGDTIIVPTGPIR